MIAHTLLAGMALISAQQEGVPASELSPAEAAIMLQGYFAQGMSATYADGDRAEGRYITLGRNSLTIRRRGYRHPGSDAEPGWYVIERHIHRFDLEPVEVRWEPELEQITVILRCEPDAHDCIMSRSASARLPRFAEDAGHDALSIRFSMFIYEGGEADEMEQLFEIWRSAPEVALAPVIYDQPGAGEQ